MANDGLITSFLGQGLAAARQAAPTIAADAIAFWWSSDTNELSAWVEGAWIENVLTGSAYTDEMAQDAVGNILTDSATIDFAYNDGANTITATAVVQAILDQITNVQGSILFRGAAGWDDLVAGTSGHFLKTNGASANPEWAASGGGGVPSGTSFPGSPATDDQFYRTDRNIQYFYDGTRWLSTTLYITTNNSVASLGSDVNHYFSLPYIGTYSVYLERFEVTTFRSATGEWDAILQWTTAANVATTLATIDGSGNATNTWVNQSATINAVIDATAKVLQITIDEVSGTSLLFGSFAVFYRLVG